MNEANEVDDLSPDEEEQLSAAIAETTESRIVRLEAIRCGLVASMEGDGAIPSLRETHRQTRTLCALEQTIAVLRLEQRKT